MLSRGQRRGLLAAGAVLALLVALYAAAGYLLAPSLVRNALIERAARAGLETRIEAIATHPFLLVVDVYDLQLARRGERLLYAPRVTVDLSWSSLWRRAWVLDRVALERPVVMALPAGAGSASAVPAFVVRELEVRQGTFALERIPRLHAVELRLSRLSTLGGAPGRFEGSAAIAGGGSLRTQGTLAARPLQLAGRLDIAEAPLELAWRYLPAPRGEAPRGTLSGAFDYRYAGGRFSVNRPRAQARLHSGGSAAAHGEVRFAPFAADLQLNVRDVPLALAEPWLALAKARVAAGTASGQGRLRLGSEARYDGAALLDGVRFEDARGGLLLAWQRLQIDTLHLRFSPFALQATAVLAEAPRARLVIGPQGELNLAQVFARRPQTTAAPGERPHMEVARLRIEAGELEFADRSLETPFATAVHDLSGAIAGISTVSDEPAQVALAGRVGRYGEARVRGAIDLESPASRTSVQLRFRNLALADFTPYAVKFAGYRIEGGRLDAQLRYRVRDGRLVGTNTLVFERLQLGEKVESPSALDLPVDLAVALLTDAQGRIDLAIPVRGDLRDPQFDLGGLIAKAVRNTLANVVSAPFRLLASLFGARDETLGAVAFDPGSAEVRPPEQEKLAQLAKALAQRPRLALSIGGGYDPQADLEALRREALFRELAEAAGYERPAGAGASAPVNPGDPKIVHAAERLYLRRGGDAFALSRLGPHTAGYARRLLDALASETDLPPQAAQGLAGRRSEAVRATLVADGVTASRIALEPPSETLRAEDGVPIELRVKPSLIRRRR